MLELFLSVIDTIATDILTLRKNTDSTHKNNTTAWICLFAKPSPKTLPIKIDSTFIKLDFFFFNDLSTL